MYKLKYFGMVFFDTTQENGERQTVYRLLVLGTSVCSLAMMPYVSHEFDDWSEVMYISFTALTNGAAALGTLLSMLIVFYNAHHKCKKYKITLESFEIYVPMGTASWNRIRWFSYSAVTFCMIIILPVNGVKLWNIYHGHQKPILMTTCLLFYYVQNLSACLTELDFAVQCYVIHTKFRAVNEELQTLDGELNREHNKRHSWAECGSRAAAETADDDNTVTSSSVVVYEKDFYRSQQKGCPMANAVELLRIKHWITREAVNDLNGLFGITMGLSMMNLLIVTFFDLYSEVFHAYTEGLEDQTTFRSQTMFVIWMIQHFCRFMLIIFTAHMTAKQASETKKIVAEMTNRFLDINTKEELHIFHNQLSISPIQFTIFYTFTLNNNLFAPVSRILKINKVVAAFATYSIMLVQFHSKNKN